MTRYAEKTYVPIDQSRQEIERALQRYGASGFGYQWERREVPIDPIPAYGKKTEEREFAAIMTFHKENTHGESNET